MTSISESAAARFEDTGYLFGKRKTVLVYFGSMLGTTLTSFTIGMLGTSLPHIVADLGGLQYLPWVISAYLLTTAATVPLWGKISDIYGRRGPYTIALGLFAAGGLTCGLAPSMPVLIAGRVINGLGAGGMVPISMAIAADLISPRERGKWTGLQQAVFGGIGIMAPAIGGWIADTASWRWNFFIVVGLGVVSLTVVWFGVRIPRPARPHQIDYLGAALIMAGAGTLLLAVTWGGEQFAWSSPIIVGLLVISAAALAAFPLREVRVSEPIFPLALFRNRTFTLAQIGIVGSHSVLLSTLTLGPLVIQGVLGLSATAAGSLMIGYGLTSMAVAVAVGQWVSRTGSYRPVLVASPIVLAVSCYGLAHLDGRSTTVEAGLDLVLFGAGIGGLNGTLIVVVQNAVAPTLQGVASAGMAFTRILAGAVAVAVVGAVMTARVGAELAKRLPGAHVTNLSVGALIDVHRASTPDARLFREAFIAGAPGAFMILLPLLVVTVGAMAMLEKRDLRRTLTETSEP